MIMSDSTYNNRIPVATLSEDNEFLRGERLALLAGATTLAFVGVKARRSSLTGLLMAWTGVLLFKAGASWLRSLSIASGEKDAPHSAEPSAYPDSSRYANRRAAAGH